MHPRQQGKEAGELEFKHIFLGSELLTTKLSCLTAMPPAADTHTSPRLDLFKGTTLAQ